MRERAELDGGKLTVWSAPASGTEIELTIPAPRAYADSAASRRGWFGERPWGERLAECVMNSESGPIRILSVDDHPLIRRGVADLVAVQTDMKVIAEAGNGREAIEQFRLHRPDITLMDLQMPQMSGLDAIIAIRGEFPEARIIVLTTYAGDVQALRALKAGARAYLLKDTLHKDLLATIRTVYAGKKSLSPEVSYQLAEHATDEALTAAEVRVVRLIAEGNANKEIAAQLSISEDTVKGQVRNILSKLGAKDRTHAAMIALRRGIIEF